MMTSSAETDLNTYSVAPADRGSISSQPNMLEVGVAPANLVGIQAPVPAAISSCSCVWPI
jgi:hypothetical protein